MARVGVDIGGTFTDLVLIDDAGHMHSHKLLTTAADPAIAVVNGINDLLGRAGRRLSDVQSIVHGTTLATNAIIERKGARTALLTTDGFRDVLETGKEQRYEINDIFIEFPKPLVRRQHRIGISERTRYDGELLTPLDPKQMREVASSLIQAGIESIAVCFLHSYANPTNEAAVKAIIAAQAPALSVSLSSDVLPEIGEYGRVSTTVANAYVQPLIEKYLDDLVRALGGRGGPKAFYVMSSAAGMMSVEVAKQFPVRLVESGPAAGVSIASHMAKLDERPNTLALDMGGTTAKICLIEQGEPTTTTEFEVARLRRFRRGSGLLLKVPAVDLIEIGAGGGSIARVNGLGLLEVGPESAGAEPGPACYGLGGEDATVTDANLLLGYLNSDFFLGGVMHLDTAKAEAAVKRSVAGPLHLTTIEAALSIHQVVNESMANAASVYAAEKGIDLREFALFAFGGAAPAHACDVARRLDIHTVVVPYAAGVLSALGCLVSPLLFDYVMGYMVRLAEVDWNRVNSSFARFESRGRALLADAGITEGIAVKRMADIRYFGQRYEVTVSLPESSALGADHVTEITTAFQEMYRRQFGRDIRDVPIEAVQWRLTVSGPRPTFSVRNEDHIDVPDVVGGASALKERRRVFIAESNRFEDCPAFNRYLLRRGENGVGPALIEDHESTTFIPPHAKFVVDLRRSLVITLDFDRRSEGLA